MNFKVPGVKGYWRRGKFFAYHRKTGTRLLCEPLTPAFFAELAALNHPGAIPGHPGAIPGQQPTAKDPRRGRARAPTAAKGTLGELFRLYRAAPEFTELAPRTRSDYQKVFDYLKPGEVARLEGITSGEVVRIRNKAFKLKKRHFANYVLTVLGIVFAFAVENDMMTGNPTAKIKDVRKKMVPGQPKANRPWQPDEVETVLAGAGKYGLGFRVAVAFGLYAAMREGDALGIGWSTYQGGWLRWYQGKTGDLVELPADPKLAAILAEARAAADAAPAVVVALPQKGVPVEEPPIVIGVRGNPYTGDGFRTIWHRYIRGLEAEGKVRPGLTFHGLRHTAGRRLAELGASPHMIAALLGHRTLAMAAHYSQEANRAQLAQEAVEKLAAPRQPARVVNFRKAGLPGE